MRSRQEPKQEIASAADEKEPWITLSHPGCSGRGPTGDAALAYVSPWGARERLSE